MDIQAARARCEAATPQWTGHDHWKCAACVAALEALEEAERELEQLHRRFHRYESDAVERTDRLGTERDRYKALAERRGEALKRNVPLCFDQDCQAVGVWRWKGPYGDEQFCDAHKPPIPGRAYLDHFAKIELDDDVLFARDAIDALPEEEKERQR